MIDNNDPTVGGVGCVAATPADDVKKPTMFRLELHIVLTSSSPELLEAITNSVKSLLRGYTGMLTFDGAKLTDIEIGGGVTEIIDVQKDPSSLPE
jgi:hypothetical protein